MNLVTRPTLVAVCS